MSNTSTSNNRQTFINGGREWVCLLDGFGPIFTRNCSRNYLCAIKIFLGLTLEKIIFFQWYNNSSEFPTRVGNMRRSFCPHFFVQGAASLVKSLSKGAHHSPLCRDKAVFTEKRWTTSSGLLFTRGWRGTSRGRRSTWPRWCSPTGVTSSPQGEKWLINSQLIFAWSYSL